MIDEHSLAQNELKVLGASESLPVPDTLDAAHKDLKLQLMNFSGAQFDSAYIKSQIIDHENSKVNFQMEINQGQNQNVKNYANKYLPHVQMHLDKAHIIADTLEKAK
jgi:putative membrane protein